MINPSLYHLAAQNGWTEIAAKLLRAKKIKVNFKDLHANTALHLAAQNGQAGVAKLVSYCFLLKFQKIYF